MTCVERIKALCKERKIPISKLESDLGFANAYIGQLRKGVMPYERLKKVAEYLNVSIEYLAEGEQTKKPATADGDGLSESDMELVDMVMRIPPEKREALRTVLQALSEDGEVFPSGDH